MRAALGERLAVALLLAAFLALGAYRLERPGLHSDELLFATPALGAGGATYDPWFGLPLMLGSYLGAPKAYLYMPLFAVTPPGPLAIRVPGLLLAAAALLGFTLFVRRAGGAAAAIFALGLLVLDPSFVFAARVDYGPTILMQVLKAASLLLLFRLVEQGRAGVLWAMAGVSLLGLYDKLNYVWVVNALAAGALVAHWRPLAETARRHRWRFWPPLLLLAVVVGTLFALQIASLLGEAHPNQLGKPLATRLRFTLDLVGATFDGSFLYRWILLRDLGRWPVALALHAAIVLQLALLAIGRTTPPSHRDTEGKDGVQRPPAEDRLRRWLLFCVVCEGVLLAQLLATRAVWGPHHVLVLWPFPQAALALSTALVLRRVRPRLGRAALAVSAAAASVAIAGQVRAGLRFTRDIYGAAATANPLFTPEIYELSRFINQRLPQVDSVITADWGMRYPLRTLAPASERLKVRDLWDEFRQYARGDGRPLYNEWFEGRRVISVSYLAQRNVFAASDSNWRHFRDKFLEPRLVVRQTRLGVYEITCTSPDRAAEDLCASVPSLK